MPVKIRRAKRRSGGEPEMLVWAECFRCGCDMFGALLPYGFRPWQVFDKGEAREAARDAWRRLGRLFIAGEHDAGFEPCWAFRQFGDP